VNSSGSLFSDSAALPASGNHGDVPSTNATTPIGNVFVTGVDNIADGNGMAASPTCNSTGASNTTLYGVNNAYVVTDTFNTAGYLPWTDLSVVGNNGTFQLSSDPGVGSQTVTTDVCTPQGGATAGQAGYCGPDGSGSDAISDAWTMDVGGTQAPRLLLRKRRPCRPVQLTRHDGLDPPIPKPAGRLVGQLGARRPAFHAQILTLGGELS
jgi:hypothetical protein